jgi:hypothetical protein
MANISMPVECDDSFCRSSQVLLLSSFARAPAVHDNGNVHATQELSRAPFFRHFHCPVFLTLLAEVGIPEFHVRSRKC